MSKEPMDQIITDYIMRANLDGQTCALKHSKEDPSEKHIAVNYLVQNIGNQFNTITDTLSIPICQDCVEALQGNNWVLLYCVNCNRSQWVYKRFAKRYYKNSEHVLFLTACPHCYEKSTNRRYNNDIF